MPTPGSAGESEPALVTTSATGAPRLGPDSPSNVFECADTATVEDTTQQHAEETKPTGRQRKARTDESADQGLHKKWTWLGVTRRLPRHTIDELVQSYRAGHSLASCSRLTGTPASTIKDALHKHDTPRPGGTHSTPNH